MNISGFHVRKITKIVSVAFVLALLLGGQFYAERPVSSASLAYTTVDLPGTPILQSSVAVADFNGDGDKELVVGGEDGILYVVAYDGGSWSVVWSRQTAIDFNAAGAPSTCVYKDRSTIITSPAIGDLDDDGRPEIIVTTGGIPASHYNGGVIVYTYNSPWSFSMVQGWPQPRFDEVGNGTGMRDPDGCWDGISSSPVVGDLDGDGDLEVAAVSLNRRIYAWHHDGTLVDSWPIYRHSGDGLLRGGVSSPAMGDIDGDGLPEVVVGTNSPPWYEGGPAPDYSKATVWAINGDSTNVPGWPVTTFNNIFSSPALGDIDEDGQLEVVVGSGSTVEGGDGRYVYAWNGDGSAVSGWPKYTAGDMVAPPALGDLDGDGQPEVVIGCGSEYGQSTTTCNLLYAWKGNGASLPGFPVAPTSNGYDPGFATPYGLPHSPVLADYDGDGSIEILSVNDRSWGPTTIESDGSYRLDAGVKTARPVFSSPLVDDVDNDGKLEVVIGGTKPGTTNVGAVYIFEVAGAATAKRPWPMFHQNMARTGIYPKPPRLGFPDVIRLYHQEGTGDTETTFAVVSNEGEGEIDWNVTHAVAELQVLPSSGSVTNTLPIQFKATTTGFSTGWHTLGTVVIAGTSEGTPVDGSPQTAVVYLYVGDVKHSYLPLVLRSAR